MENRIEIAVDEDNPSALRLRRYYNECLLWTLHGAKITFPHFGPDDPLCHVAFVAKLAPLSQAELGDGVHNWENENSD